MSYLGVAVTFLAALIALKGGTWEPQKAGLIKLTTTGWVAVVIALTGLVGAVWKTYDDQQAGAAVRANLQSVQGKLEKADTQLQSANKSLRESNTKINKLEDELREARQQIKTLVGRSDLGIQLTMTKPISLMNSRIWEAPRIAAGSKVEIYIFGCKLILRTPYQIEAVSSGSGQPSIHVLRGNSGEMLRVSLQRMSGEGCQGKFLVYSTPVSRSPEFSDSHPTLRR